MEFLDILLPYQKSILYKFILIRIAQLTGRTTDDIKFETLNLWLQQNESLFDSHDNVPTPQNTALQLNIIPLNNAYYLLVQLEHKYLIQNQYYSKLEDALLHIKKHQTTRSIDLKEWSSITGEHPPVFLQKAKGTPHIWIGQNSICNIFKNQIVKLDGFELSTTYPTQHICKTCVKHYKKLSSPKFHISFDNENNPLPPPIQNFDPLF